MDLNMAQIVFENVSLHYQTSIERRLSSAIGELLALQARR